MEIKIDFQSTNRFKMSLGIALVTISLILGYFFFDYVVRFFYASQSKESFLVIISLLVIIFGIIVFICFFVSGVLFSIEGYNGLKESEGLEEKFKSENMVNQILDQDLKLIDIKLKHLEYNEKLRSLKEIDRSKSLGIQELNEVRYRDIQNVVAQAFDPNFYENTYPEIFKNITKKSKEIKNKKAG